MQTSLAERVERGRELLRTVRHAAMATVNADGSPHNTPFLFMRDAGLTRVFWGSHPESVHSQNILRTGQLFIVLYDAQERGGLYIRAADGHALEGAELEQALTVHNSIRAARQQPELPLSYYSDDSPQRMWTAAIRQLWVNGTTRDSNGNIVQDIRTEVSANDLLE